MHWPGLADLGVIPLLIWGTIQPGGAFGENLTTRFGDADRMFKLGGKGAIAGDRRPAIIEHFHAIFAQIDHGLDSKEHAGAQFRTGAGPSGMHDLW